MTLPGPRRLAAARWGLRLQRDPCRALEGLHDEFGDVVEITVAGRGFVFAFGRDANEAILRAPPSQLRWREALAALIPVDGDTALVVTDGAEHDRRRRLVQPAFGTKAINSHLPLMVGEIDRAIDRWPPGAQVDSYVELRAAIRRIVVGALFGEALLGRADEIGDLLEPMLEFVNRPPLRQVKLNLPGTLWGRARRGKGRADEIVFDEIRARRRDAGVGTDILSVLVATSEDGVGLTDGEIRDQVVSLIAAGYDTTSAAAAWLVLEMLANPGVWDRAAAEVDAVVGDGEVTEEHIRALRYVDGVVQEVLRLRPPGVVSGRYVVAPFALGDVVVPAGRTIIYSPYVTQRSADLWPEPTRFDPTRWDPAATGYVEPQPQSFVPFGGAYRRCIGFAFATLELKVLCIELVRRVRPAPCLVPGPVRPVGIAAMRPRDGVHVVMPVARSASHATYT